MPKVSSSSKRYFTEAGRTYGTLLHRNIAQLLDFLGVEYKYDTNVPLEDGTSVKVDFDILGSYIVILEERSDKGRMKTIEKLLMAQQKILVVSNTGYSHSLEGLDLPMVATAKKGDFDYSKNEAIFLDDPSFTFDYSHILPYSDKCSVLHGHTSSVIIELLGRTEKGMILEFGELKRRIRDCLRGLDHKLFISKKYLVGEDKKTFNVAFEGPNGYFDLKVPKSTTFLLEGEATVENLADVVLEIVSPAVVGGNVEALGVYVYEGLNKGAHLLKLMKH